MAIVTRRMNWYRSGWTAGLLAGVVVACGPQLPKGADLPPGSSRAAAPTAAGSAENLLTAPDSAPQEPSAPEFERLVGRWVRIDGGYVLEVRAVDPRGKAEAAYLNPRPIHVEQALATRAGSTLTLFVELQDVNYPGSTYNLAFDPTGDRLEGNYYQAVEGQTFTVSFERR